MNARRTWLLACATLLGCFNPTGNTDTSGLPATAGTPTSSSDGGTNMSTTSGASTGATLTTATSTTVAPTTMSTTGSTGGVCGDGQIDDGEECDDGGAQDGCSDSCTKEFRRVFVTSKVYTGNLGGLAGADQKCQDAADQAVLPGTYRAWLSTPTSSPADWLVHSSVPYRDLNGLEIASSWSDLIDGTLKNGIYLSELKGLPGVGTHSCLENSRPVWTNTQTDASTYTPDMHCENWEGSGSGFAGLAGDISASWTVGCIVECEEEAALYCLEH